MEPLSSHQHVFRSLFLPLSRTSCSLSRHLLDNFPRGMVGSRLAPLQVTRSPLRFFLAFYTSCPSPPLSSPLECSTLYLFKFPCITHICLHNSFMTISIYMSMTPGDSSRFTTSPLFSAYFSANTVYAFRLPPKIAASRGQFPATNEMQDLYSLSNLNTI